jgi:hypothetical protein
MQISKPFLFDSLSGIEKILRQDLESIRLPDLPELQPSELFTPDQLENYLSLPTLDDYIASSLRALIHDANILSPKRFRIVLSSTAKTLRDLAKHNPKMARRFGRLALLLDEDQALFDLLQIYRSALVQG